MKKDHNNEYIPVKYNKFFKAGLFAFDNYKDFFTLYTADNKIDVLIKHLYENLYDCKDKNIVIPGSKILFSNSSWDYLQWVKEYKNKDGVMVINDANDRIFCNPAYLLWCLETGRGIYLKKNLSYNYDYGRHMKKRKGWMQMKENEYKKMYSNALYNCLFPNAESPVIGNIEAYIKYNMDWKPWKKREYDVFWAGQNRRGSLTGDKVEGIKKVKQAVKKLGLKFLIVGSKPSLGRRGYMETISNSRFCYNFSVGPLRNRREWEVLLGGGCLVQDPRTKNMERNIMEDYKHFTYFSYDNFIGNLEELVNNQDKYEEIAYEGWKLAQECWTSIPSLDLRLSVVQGLTRKRVNTIEDLKKMEEYLRWLI